MASTKPRATQSVPARNRLAAAVMGAIRADSFKSLTHKLEGEGKSAHYAKAIAGKVAKEKGDVGKRKDAQPDAVQPAEDHKMADVSEFRSRLDKMREAIDAMCTALGDAPDGDVEDDADEAEEDKAGEELAQGAKDERDGDEKEGEEDEHKAGEELAAGRDDASHEQDEKDWKAGGHKANETLDREHPDRSHEGSRDDAESEEERSKAGKVARRHQLETERGDETPTEMAEKLTEADAMSHAEHVRIGKESHRDDAQRSDAEIRAKIASLEAKLARATRPVSREERDAMARAQARCDSVAQMFGLRAEAPLAGEHLDSYRRRLVAPLMKYSERAKKINVDRLDSQSFPVIEDMVYADAQAAAKSPAAATPGRLVPQTFRDEAGRLCTKYTGDPLTWMGPMMGNVAHIRFAPHRPD